jgi:predicted outer membrane protein
MKHLFLRTVLVVAVCFTFGVAGFAQYSQSRTSKSSSIQNSASEKAFLQKAMEANEAEIELGHMAQSKAEDQRVKDFAAMMVHDHTNALNRLREVSASEASQKSSSKPRSKTSNSQTNSNRDTASNTDDIQLSKEHQQLRDRLMNLSGSAFDREYVNAMVQEHQKDVRAFESEAGVSNTTTRQKPSSDTSGGDISSDTSNNAKSVARELLPTLQMHLTEAQSLQRELQLR